MSQWTFFFSIMTIVETWNSTAFQPPLKQQKNVMEGLQKTSTTRVKWQNGPTKATCTSNLKTQLMKQKTPAMAECGCDCRFGVPTPPFLCLGLLGHDNMNGPLRLSGKKKPRKNKIIQNVWVFFTGGDGRRWVNDLKRDTATVFTAQWRSCCSLELWP